MIVVDNEGGDHYPCLVIDNVAGGELAARYLIERGHRKIGFVGDRPDDEFGFTPSHLRFQGFQRVLTKAGLPCEDAWYRFGFHGRDVARQHTLEILAHPDRPTAIFAASDVQAFGVLAAARELDLHVPDHLAIIGFDDIEIAQYMHLTTVRQPLFESGKLGAQMMLDWLDRGTATINRQVMPLEIAERNTV
jgi:DNA-binding LacI/PurR family transcriptional regulator